MHGHVTLKEIAAACGVSVSAVSQILNNKPGDFSSPQTKLKVMETARQMGYKKSFSYSLLHGGKTSTVAVMVHMQRGMYEEYITDLILQLTQELEKKEYSSYVAVMGNDAGTNLKKVREYITRGVGHFIMLNRPRGYAEISAAIHQAKAMETGIHPWHERCVVADFHKAFSNLLSYIRSKVGENYRFLTNTPVVCPVRLSVFAGQYPALSQEELFQKYFRYLFPIAEIPEEFPNEAFDSGCRTVMELLQKEKNIKALVCVNDAFAIGAAAGVRKLGLQVGKDILIAGCNNDKTTRFAADPISSIDFGWRKMAPLLAEKALTDSPCREFFEAELIIRE